MTAVLQKHWPDITLAEVEAAAAAAYDEYAAHMAAVRKRGAEIIAEARKAGRRIIVLAGRPYHVDPEINHGIDKLICSHGAAVVTEDSISHLVQKFDTRVLNQWTYHARLYAAAKYIADQPDMDLVQLVSFGCGVDAITTDETREIFAARGQAVYPNQNRRDYELRHCEYPPAQPVCRAGAVDTTPKEVPLYGTTASGLPQIYQRDEAHPQNSHPQHAAHPLDAAARCP